jgi:hypothetical protein
MHASVTAGGLPVRMSLSIGPTASSTVALWHYFKYCAMHDMCSLLMTRTVETFCEGAADIVTEDVPYHSHRPHVEVTTGWYDTDAQSFLSETMETRVLSKL